MKKPLLSIQNLTVSVLDEKQERLILDGVNLSVFSGKIVALVGGSGSGKSTLALTILRLLSPAFRIQSGSIRLEGQDLFQLSEEEMRKVRGSRIGLAFQEPLNAFNPLLTVGTQIDEVLKAHTPLLKKERQERVRELLAEVELPEAPRIIKSFPHQLSGGMRQRAMTAQALAAGPGLLIADEPTSSLDVTLQARIIELFRKLQKELRLSMLLITHELGMVQSLADEVFVLQQGRIVESGPTETVMSRPQHPYTIQLLEALLK